MCLLDFWTRINDYSCLLGDKSDALRVDEKKYGGTKQQMNALPKFEILAMWYEFGSSVSD